MVTQDDDFEESIDEDDTVLVDLDDGDLDDDLPDEEEDDDDLVAPPADDDDADEAVVEDDDDEDDVVVDDDDEDEEDEEESLEVLLGRDAIDDEVRGDDVRDGLTKAKVAVGDGEFTCRSCFLVKRRAQLADVDRMVCLDCA